MNNDDDLDLQTYQDDLTTDDNATDPLMDEDHDNPADELGIPEDEYKDELEKELSDEDEDQNSNRVDIQDDQREYTEDQFELDDDSDARTGTTT